LTRAGGGLTLRSPLGRAGSPERVTEEQIRFQLRHLIAAAVLLAGLASRAGAVDAKSDGKTSSGPASRYAPRSPQELRAQYMLLIELRQAGALDEKSTAAELSRLEGVAKDKFSLTLSASDLGLVVQTQKIQWFAAGLRLIGIALGLLVAVPLARSVFVDVLRPLWRKLQLLLRPLWERLWPPVLAWLLSIRDAAAAAARKLRDFLRSVPFWIYELLGYAIVGALLLVQRGEYVSVIGAALLPGMLTVSFKKRCAGMDDQKKMSWISGVSFALWTLAAFLQASRILGFLSVAALMFWLGFAISVFPGTIAFGFRANKVEYFARTSVVSLFLLVFAWLVFYTRVFPASLGLEKQLGYFRYGIFSIGSMGYYLGLLILSSPWCGDDNKFYVGANAAALTTGPLFLVVAFLDDIGFHFWVCVFYLVFLLTEKYYTFVLSRLGRIWGGALAAALFSLGGWWLKANMARVTVLLAPFLP
jgi:hypothetical protein